VAIKKTFKALQSQDKLCIDFRYCFTCKYFENV